MFFLFKNYKFLFFLTIINVTMIIINKIKFADVLLILLFVATIIYFSINFFVKNKNTVKQVIIESGKNIWYYQLDKDKIIEVKGILGESTIKIEDGFVFFENSPCPNKLCVHSSAISKNGDWVACLPNGVFVRIEGNNEISEIDGISY